MLLGDYFVIESISIKKNVDRNRVLNFLTKYKDKLIIIKGNNDKFEDFVNIDSEIYYSYLLEIDNVKILLTHGDKLSEYLNMSNLFIYGHEHKGYIKKENDKTFICCGSISLPAYGSKETYAVLENDCIKVKTLNNSIVDSFKLK